MKTMIAFASGVNFAFLRTKRTGAEISIVLAERPPSPRITGSVAYSRVKAIYRVPLRGASELDFELETWLRDAYELCTNPPEPIVRGKASRRRD